VVELRVPEAPILDRLPSGEIETVLLGTVAYLDEEGNTLQVAEYDTPVNLVNEENGVVYLPPVVESDEVVRFSIGGAVAGGVGTWGGRARMDGLNAEPGDTLGIELDVTMTTDAPPEALVGVEMFGRFSLQPVALEDGFVTSAGELADNGWSSVLTPSGLAINNLTHTIPIGEGRVSPADVIVRGDTLLFGIPARLTIPEDLPPGVYVMVFEGYAQVGDGEPFRWAQAGLFGEGTRAVNQGFTRTPAVLNIGRDATEPVRTLWTLFHAQPSDGSLGLMAAEDTERAALSNNVRFNSPTYILPPGAPVPYEPYMVNMLPNRYDVNAAPLLPLLFPNGRLTATVRKPDGDVDNLATTPVLQNVLSTAAVDERDVFGAQAPLDIYRLATLNEAFAEPALDQYGDYEVEMTGFVEDVWGNRYEGGGTYTFIVAETLDLSPAALPGTPLTVGDTLPLGVRVSPGVPADVTVSYRFYPVDGGEMTEGQASGTANAYGVFNSPGVVASGAGEYVVDYDVRYTDADGRLWAGSLRGAGVVAPEEPGLTAHGLRGVANENAAFQSAWYLVDQILPGGADTARLNTPYHVGDIASVRDLPTTGLQPGSSVQDTGAGYADWLRATHPDYVTPGGLPVDEAVVRDALPVATLDEDRAASEMLPLNPEAAANTAYSYLSYVTPAVSARQTVLGRPLAPGELFWDMDDPLLGQVGAGAAGMAPGDYAFLFGGSVLRNTDAEIAEVAAYSGLAVGIDPSDERGGRVFPPYRGAAGGPDGGPLLDYDGNATPLFFHPTGVRPGDVYSEGDTMVVAGHAAPPLASDVAVTVTSPSGVVTAFGGQANAVGFFHEPSAGVSLDEPGVWTVQTTLTHTGPSSAGETPLDPPPSVTQSFNVYVVPEGNTRLAWDDGNDIPFSAGFPFNFTFDVPPGWTDVTGYLTLAFPGAVAEDGTLPIQGTALRYQFNPTNLSNRFPFYEGADGRVDGPASSDPVTLTFVITGDNAAGRFDVLARQVTLRHDRLITLD